MREASSFDRQSLFEPSGAKIELPWDMWKGISNIAQQGAQTPQPAAFVPPPPPLAASQAPTRAGKRAIAVLPQQIRPQISVSKNKLRLRMPLGAQLQLATSLSVILRVADAVVGQQQLVIADLEGEAEISVAPAALAAIGLGDIAGELTGLLSDGSIVSIPIRASAASLGRTTLAPRSRSFSEALPSTTLSRPIAPVSGPPESAPSLTAKALAGLRLLLAIKTAVESEAESSQVVKGKLDFPLGIVEVLP